MKSEQRESNNHLGTRFKYWVHSLEDARNSLADLHLQICSDLARYNDFLLASILLCNVLEKLNKRLARVTLPRACSCDSAAVHGAT